MAGQLINGENHLTVTETARRIGVSDETVRRWLRLGKLPGRKLTQTYFIREKDVDEFLKSQGH